MTARLVRRVGRHGGTARADRLPAAAERAQARAAHHGDRSLAVHPERVPRVLRAAADGYPRPTVLEGSIDIIGVRFRGCRCSCRRRRRLRWSPCSCSCNAAGRAGRCARSPQDSEIASLMGINVDRVVVMTFSSAGCWPASPACCSRSRSRRSSSRWASGRASRRSRPPCSAASAASAARRSAGS